MCTRTLSPYLLSLATCALQALLTPSAACGQHLDFLALDPLPTRLDTLDDDEVIDLAHRLLSQTTDIREVFLNKAQRATLERQVLEQQLAATLDYGEATSEDIKALQVAIAAAKNEEKAALSALQKAERTLAAVQKTTQQPPRTLRKSLPKIHKQVFALLPPVEEKPIADILQNIGTPATDTASMSAPTLAAPDTPAASKPAAPPPTPPRPVFKKYDLTADVVLNPPPRGCALLTDTRDEFSGERRRELQREELFRHTNPALRPYLQGREHIICQASVSQNGKLYLLNLTFAISDANAKRTFGSLPRNSVAILKFLDGETLALTNLRADEGRTADDKVTHIFTGQYPLDANALRKMQKALLDKVRIAWATGYEDYEVHQVDLIARQLGCLLK